MMGGALPIAGSGEKKKSSQALKREITNLKVMAGLSWTQIALQFLCLSIFICAQVGCSNNRSIHFSVVHAVSRTPVSNAHFIAHEHPGSITLLDFVRPQWTYRAPPEAVTDHAGHTVLKIPLSVGSGVRFQDRQGNLLPIGEHAQSSVCISKDGFQDAYIFHSINEWKALAKGNSHTRPIVVELKGK